MDNKSVKAKRPFLIFILLFLNILFFSIAVYQQAVIERQKSIIRTITRQYTSLRERFIRLTKEK